LLLPQPIIPVFHYSNIPGKVPEILFDQQVTKTPQAKFRNLRTRVLKFPPEFTGASPQGTPWVGLPKDNCGSIEMNPPMAREFFVSSWLEDQVQT